MPLRFYETSKSFITINIYYRLVNVNGLLSVYKGIRVNNIPRALEVGHHPGFIISPSTPLGQSRCIPEQEAVTILRTSPRPTVILYFNKWISGEWCPIN